MEGPPPDIIVSGINLGVNLGDDVTYSGTVAAALEGILLGYPAIAVSAQATDLDAAQWDGTAYDFRAAADFVARLVPRVLEGHVSPRVLLNVNAPGLAPEARARRPHHPSRAADLPRRAGARGDRRGPAALHASTARAPRTSARTGTDFAAIEAGEISVTPMHFDLTDIDEMGNLERMRVAELLPERPVTRGA